MGRKRSKNGRFLLIYPVVSTISKHLTTYSGSLNLLSAIDHKTMPALKKMPENMWVKRTSSISPKIGSLPNNWFAGLHGFTYVYLDGSWIFNYYMNITNFYEFLFHA